MKNLFKNTSMRTKLILYFTIPIIVLSTIIVLASAPILGKGFSEKIEYSASQSCQMAAYNVDDYCKDMVYIGKMVVENYTIKSILEDAYFEKNKPIDEQYRDFIEISNILGEMEVSHPRCRIGIYIDDDMMYSENYHYFFPMSDLLKSDSYKFAQENSENKNEWFGLAEDVDNFSAERYHNAIVLYKMIYRENKPTYAVRISMDMKYFQNLLKNANGSKTGNLAFFNNSNQLMYTDADASLDFNNILERKEKHKEGMSLIKYKNTNYYVLAAEMEVMGTLLVVIPKNEIDEQTRWVTKVYVPSFIGIAIIVIIVAYFLSGYYVSRLKTLSNKMQDIQAGDLSADIIIPYDKGDSKDEITQIYGDFNYMLEAVKVTMKEHYKMGKNVKNAQLKALQAQINPHFLYNTLDLMNWMAIDYGADEIAELSRSMAQFFRLSLNHGKELLLLKEEILHVKAYVDIQNYHFDNAIELSVNIPEELYEFACPNITLQPFVENSIVHVIGENPDIEKVKIEVGAKTVEGDILLWVKDDGTGISKEILDELLPESLKQDTKGYGIKNINFRLKLYYGQKYGVTYESKLDEGTTVYVLIPKMTLDEMEKLIE